MADQVRRSDIEAADSRGTQLAYRRVALDIESRIKSGELVPGARLLSERHLAEYYGVAFHTVRHAMQILRERDLIVSIHGRGTFVSESPATRPPAAEESSSGA
jgi:DNA-binding GntR family transcriptional regulator